jgi:hypothetical protein
MISRNASEEGAKIGALSAFLVAKEERYKVRMARARR